MRNVRIQFPWETLAKQWESQNGTKGVYESDSYIHCTPPSTAPQRFESLFIAGDCEKWATECQCQDARAWTSGICVGLPRNTSSHREEALTTLSAKSTATKATTSGC